MKRVAVRLRQSLGALQFIWRHPLNRGRRLAAIGRYLRWQVGSRLAGGRVIVPWIDDARFVAGTGDTSLTGNLYAGLMEFEDMAFLLHALRPTDRFVDVGANVGAYTILASQVVKAQTLAFEPIPSTAERLMDQVLVNRMKDRVRVRNAGVGDRPGTLRFTCSTGAFNKVSISERDGPTMEVPVTNLDAEVSGSEPLFLKIDVEGFEFNVITGAVSLLDSESLAAVIIELNGRGEEFGHTNEEIHQRLIAHRLTAVRYEPRSRTLTPLSSYNGALGNTIYVRNLEFIHERCRSAPIRIVHSVGGARI